MSVMIQNPEAYFRQFIPVRNELLLELEDEAQHEEIPIIGPVVGELLYILARATGADKILELGTATGYSAIYLASACESSGGRVITLEIDKDMADRAWANFKKAGTGWIVYSAAIMMKPLKNAPFCPISASDLDFNPRNTQCMPVVKIFVFLELEQN